MVDVARMLRSEPRLGVWLVCGAVLELGAIALWVAGGSFADRRMVAELPIMAFAGCFSLVAGMVLLGFGWLSVRATDTGLRDRRLIGFVFLAGLAARLTLLQSEPILEVDFNRYLWDGGLVWNGFNPYAVAPAQIAGLSYNDLRLELSKSAGQVFERISYPALKTVYPPVAQAAFAVAHWLEPWSLVAWRLVCLGCEVATFGLLLALFDVVRRNQLLVVFYWWNPLVIKEIANSGHMEAVLLPLVLSALLLAARARPIAAGVMLVLATGTKVWPVLLLPLILRPLIARPRVLAFTVVAFAGLFAAMFAPIVVGGLDATSGFVGFALHWNTNSALFPILRGCALALLSVLPVGALSPDILARAVAGLLVLAVALWGAATPSRDARDMLVRAYLIVSVLVLLSPAQFPWYVLWVLPLAALLGGVGWLIAAATIPLYYVSFHFLVQGTYPANAVWITAIIWVPVWTGLTWDFVRWWQSSRIQRLQN